MAPQYTNPFADAFKAFTDFSATNTKTPSVDVNALISLQRRNAETLSAVNQVVTESIQAVIRRQAEILQANASDAFQFFKEVTSSSSPENATAKQTAFAKNALETALSNTRELAEMVSKSNIEVFDVIGKRISENANEVASAAAKKNAA
jgi:phasin family protein